GRHVRATPEKIDRQRRRQRNIRGRGEMRSLKIETAIRSDPDQGGERVACSDDAGLCVIDTGAHQGNLALRLLHTRGILQPRGDPLLSELENRDLLLEVR